MRIVYGVMKLPSEEIWIHDQKNDITRFADPGSSLTFLETAIAQLTFPSPGCPESKPL